MLGLKIFHNEEKGFILLGMLFIMVLMAVTALGMNRHAAMQAKMAVNQFHAVQTNFGRLAAIEHAAWQLINKPNWRTGLKEGDEDYKYSDVTYNRKVLDLDPPIDGYTNVVTITVTSPGGDKSASTSFRVTASQANSYFIADTNNCRIRKVDGSGEITTVAGNGTFGYSGDGGTATEAQLDTPKGVAIDASGNIYIADTGNHCIRKVDGSGVINTIAGIGDQDGYSGDGGQATQAELDNPNDVFVDSSGNIYIADTDNHRIRKVDAASPYNINTIAGTGSKGDSGDGGPATEAKIGFPRGVYVDSSGNIYIADTYNHRIRKVDAASPYNINTIAGTGSKGDLGDGGPATEAELYNPYGVFLDTSGNIFIADQKNNRIRKVDASTGIITTVAGNGTGGYSGDDGQATEANIESPKGLCVDVSGNILIADTDNHCIRKVDASTGIITTIAGTPDSWGYSGDNGPATEAQLGGAEGVAAYVPPSTKKYYLIADTDNHCIRKVDASTGIITTVAGNGSADYSGDGEPATSANLDTPKGVAVDALGNIYIADTNNHRIRKVDASTQFITTVAGNGTDDYNGDDIEATSAMLDTPKGVAVDALGNIYIADTNNHRIRKVDASTGIITTVAGNGTVGYPGDGGPATDAQLSGPEGVWVYEESSSSSSSSSLEKVTEIYKWLDEDS